MDSSGDSSRFEERTIPDLITRTTSVVIKHLNEFGACVIDGFLGEANGVDILDEVMFLKELEMFQVHRYHICYFQKI